MTHEPEDHSLERFNPIADMKALTARLDDEPTENRHLGVLPLEWLAKDIFETSSPQDDDPKSMTISFLTKDSRPEAYHLLTCKPCLEIVLGFAALYRFPNIPDIID